MFPRLPARATFVADTKNASDFVQKHFVSTTNVSQFAQHGDTTFILFPARLRAQGTSWATMCPQQRVLVCKGLNIFSKQIISSNTKRRKQMLNFVWNTQKYWWNETDDQSLHVFAQVLWIMKFIFSRSHGKMFSMLSQEIIYVSSFKKMWKWL